jgi:hypothetical protein
MDIKKALESVLPDSLVKTVRTRLSRGPFADYKRLSTKDVFAKVYADGIWGRSNDSQQKFFSGTGSHDQAVTSVYVGAVRSFVQSLGFRPAAVDLGCGDFQVGAQLRDLFGTYVACDIVPSLVAFNQARYGDLDVDFRVLDLTADPLPAGDVILLRQVLQHLSNEQIKKVVPKLATRCKYLVLTEHVPEGDDFVANLDMPTGPGIRLGLPSGVVLTEPPFDLQAKQQNVLCEVRESGGVVRTTLFTFA